MWLATSPLKRKFAIAAGVQTTTNDTVVLISLEIAMHVTTQPHTAFFKGENVDVQATKQLSLHASQAIFVRLSEHLQLLALPRLNSVLIASD
jgi:hypothetical protein